MVSVAGFSRYDKKPAGSVRWRFVYVCRRLGARWDVRFVTLQREGTREIARVFEIDVSASVLASFGSFSASVLSRLGIRLAAPRWAYSRWTDKLSKLQAKGNR